MNSVSKKSKNYNTQMAVSYIAYMMGGSYFHQCRCVNPLEAKHLFLHYAEMPGEQQYRYEAKMLQCMEQLSPMFLQILGELNCEAVCYHKYGEYRIDFRTGGFESVRCTVSENGNCTITPCWG